MRMRQPTPTMALLRWHRAALRGESVPVHDGDPQCGWYRTKLVKGGPWVAVEIICEREIDAAGELTSPEKLVAIIEGRRADPARLWTYLTPISRAEHTRLEDERLSGGQMAATMARIDLTGEPTRP